MATQQPYRIHETYGVEPSDDVKQVLASAFRQGRVHRTTLERSCVGCLELDAAFVMAQELGLTVVDYDGRPMIIQE